MKDKSSAEISLIMNIDQAKVLRDACELLARIRIGQIEQVAYTMMDADMSLMKHKEFLRKLTKQKSIGDDEKADIAWDLYQVIRHTIAWHENPSGGISVIYDPPFQASCHPLAECRVELPE